MGYRCPGCLALLIRFRINSTAAGSNLSGDQASPFGRSRPPLGAIQTRQPPAAIDNTEANSDRSQHNNLKLKNGTAQCATCHVEVASRAACCCCALLGTRCKALPAKPCLQSPVFNS
jgi:hypothetical protein